MCLAFDSFHPWKNSLPDSFAETCCWHLSLFLGVIGDLLHLLVPDWSSNTHTLPRAAQSSTDHHPGLPSQHQRERGEREREERERERRERVNVRVILAEERRARVHNYGGPPPPSPPLARCWRMDQSHDEISFAPSGPAADLAVAVLYSAPSVCVLLVPFIQAQSWSGLQSVISVAMRDLLNLSSQPRIRGYHCCEYPDFFTLRRLCLRRVPQPQPPLPAAPEVAPDVNPRDDDLIMKSAIYVPTTARLPSSSSTTPPTRVAIGPEKLAIWPRSAAPCGRLVSRYGCVFASCLGL